MNKSIDYWIKEIQEQGIELHSITFEMFIVDYLNPKIKELESRIKELESNK